MDSSLSTSEVFKYTPISPWKFRLVDILPGKNAQEISCNLKTATINQDSKLPQYFALSYVWGNPNDAVGILLGGKAFKVTTNLYAVLYQLRHYQESRVFWIDAIYMNQMNIVERNHQIRLMKNIYKSAKQVVI